MAVFTSPQAAVAAARDRMDARLGTFPAKVWADGHSPGKEPIIVPDGSLLSGTIEQAIGVSRDEFGKNGAVVEWASSLE